VALHSFIAVSLATNFLSNSVPAIIIYSSIYIPCYCLAMASLYMTTVTDPGAVPLGARPLASCDEKKAQHAEVEMVETTSEAVEDKSLMAQHLDQDNQMSSSREEDDNSELRAKPTVDIPRCEKCDGNYKPPRAHHDKFTGRCIVKLDHYCPFVCNAIGALNHKYFFLFILYTFIVCIAAGIILILRFIRCGYRFGVATQDNWLGLDYDPIPGCKDPSSLVVIATFTLTAWFTLVSTVSLLGQFPVITTGNALVARKKIRQGKAEEKEIGRVRTDFNEMFGGTSNHFALHWLLPMPPLFPEGAKEEILGYKYESYYGEIPGDSHNTLMNISNAECA